MAGPPNIPDPDRIDISLDLVGQESLAAVQALTDQLSTFSTYLASAQTGSSEAQQQGLANLARGFAGGRRVGRVFENAVSPSASLPHNSPQTPDNAGRNASDARLLQEHARGGFGGTRRFLGNIRDNGITSAVDQELAIYGATERQQTQRRGGRDFVNTGYSDSPYAPLMGGYPSVMDGSPSPSASVPTEANVTSPTWRSALRSNMGDWERAQEGFRLPPGGLSLNWQQKTEIASDYFVRRAENQFQQELASRQQQRFDALNSLIPAAVAANGLTPADMAVNMSDFQSNSGRMGGLLRLASQQAGPVALAQDALRGIQNIYQTGGALQQAGVQAGFQRAGQITIPGTNIGFTNPLDFFHSGSAANEGLRQRVTETRLRLMGGINGTQAQQIVGGLAGMGWTGGDATHIGFDAIAPLVQQGMNPELAVASYDMIMRQGNSSLTDFLSVMDKLGQSARAANMSLDEYQQGLMEFSKVAEGLGATGAQGAMLGRGMSDAFGIAPQVSAEILQSPLVQASALQAGFLPNEVGLMNTNVATDATNRALDMAMRATAGFRGRTIRDPITHRIVATGQSQQIAQVASIMGLPTNLVERLMRQRDFSRAAGNASSLLSAYGQDLAASKRTGIRIESTSTPAHPTYSAGRGGGVTGMAPATHTVVTSQGEAMGQHLDEDWRKVVDQLRGGAPDAMMHPLMRKDYMRQLHDLGKISDPGKRQDAANAFIRHWSTVGKNQADDTGPTVYVKFKGAAAKYFEQDNSDSAKSRRASNQGGMTQAQIAAAGPTSRAAEENLRNYLLTQSGGMIGN